VSRVRQFAPWVLGLLAAAPLAPAAAQNLDAGKPASQIFAEVCTNCHRSPREFRSNPGVSFLREHYTTGSEMASTMAAYLSAGVDPRGGPQPKRPPATTTPAAAARDTPAGRETPAGRDTATARETPVEPASRRAQQSGDPKALPAPASTRARPASARADAAKPDATAEAKPPTADAKPPVAPPPAPRPALEEFEE
jgi:hypothetical protein